MKEVLELDKMITLLDESVNKWEDLIDRLRKYIGYKYIDNHVKGTIKISGRKVELVYNCRSCPCCIAYESQCVKCPVVIYGPNNQGCSSRNSEWFSFAYLVHFDWKHIISKVHVARAMNVRNMLLRRINIVVKERKTYEKDKV